MEKQLELFKNSLPYKPWCSDDLLYGLKVLPQAQAILKRYIQTNPPAFYSMITQDCDHVNALEKCLDAGGPPPNLSVINKKNGHSHLLWGLNSPVCKTDAGRQKPLDYLACIEFALREKVGGDWGYQGFITKNPLSDHWLVVAGREEFYDLNELAEYLEVPAKLPSHAKVLGVGRNISLFEAGRKWAYKQVLQYRVTGDRDGFYEAVEYALEVMNDFPEPLPYREVRQIGKSIAKWTWNVYTKSWTGFEFSQVQAYRARRGKGVARYRHDEETRSQAVLMVLDGVSQVEVAKHFGVTQKTISKWCAVAAK